MAESDRLILYDDGGILTNDTNGFSTINQRAKSILCETGKGSQGCTVNDRCCTCTTGSCDTEKIIDDLAVALQKISKSSAVCLGRVANTLNDLIADVIVFFEKTDEIMSREKLAKNIPKTCKSFEKILSTQSEAIGIVIGHVVEIIRLLQLDLKNITDARSVQSKNSAASELGHHLIFLLDITAELTKITCDVCNLTNNLSEGIYSITLVTTTVLFYVQHTLAANAVQVNQVGFKNDTASNICLHVSSALDEYVFVIQRISQCHTVQSLKDALPTVASSLCATRTKFVDGIGVVIGFSNKYPVSPVLFGFVDSILDSVRGSKHLSKAEAVISETVFSLFDVSKLILAARFSCACINGFTESVDISIRKVLVYLHATFFMIANIGDDCFSCGNSLSMLLATMNSIVLKIILSVDEIMQSILSLGEITVGGASLISLFEAVVDVAVSVLQCIAFIFTELSNGSHLVNLQEAVPRIMLGAKSKIIAAKDRLSQRLKASSYDYPYNADTFIDASLTILSLNGFNRNIADLVTDLDCSKGDDTVDDASTTKVDIFVGKLKTTAEGLSGDGVGKVIAGAVNEICDEVYDTLIRLSTLSLEKGDVLKLTCLIISNYYYALITLTSIFNSSHYGINISVF